MSRSTRRLLLMALAGFGGSLAAVTGLSLFGLTGAESAMLGRGFGVLVAVAAAAALAALWISFGIVAHHFDALERLRADLLIAAGTGADLPRRWQSPEESPELRQVAIAAAEAIGRERTARTAPDARLAAVVAAAAEGLVVITETGLVTLVNAAALTRFGGGRLMVGTSIYAVYDRHDVDAAAARAHAEGRPVAVPLRTVEGEPVAARVADLGGGSGFVLSFAEIDTDCAPAVYHDLALHDAPPVGPPVGPGTPLDGLPVLVLDCETTGLDVAADRIVSIGAVRLHGRRIFPQVNFDCLVDPGMTIPARATAVHGITNAMVAGAPSFAEVYGRLRPLMSGTVVVGHNIGFDMALLRREAALAGLACDELPTLDTLRLVAALRPRLADLNLEAIAAELGADVSGRHTALGDSLVTADIYLRLIPLLADAGVTTFGDACRLAETPRALIRRQRAAGW